MIALFWLLLALSVSPFKSKNGLAAENAALRHQLIVLQRRVRGRVQLTNEDRTAEASPGRRYRRARGAVAVKSRVPPAQAAPPPNVIASACPEVFAGREGPHEAAGIHR